MDKLTTIFLAIFLFYNMEIRTSLAAGDGICRTMVLGQNYPCEEHTVTTGDGYILSLQNIPFGLSGKTAGQRPPVVLQHGLLTDAVIWLLSPPDQSLAFILADNGFDVWLVSSRGTKYSLGHTSLTPDDAAFWDWTWDELVAHDLPATIQYVNNQTEQKPHYVGHSMNISPDVSRRYINSNRPASLGTLIALAAFSKGQLANMLRSAAMLCPIAYVGNTTSPMATNGAKHLLAETLYWLNIHEFNPLGDAVLKLMSQICNQKGVDCSNLMTVFTGPNCCLNSSIGAVFLQHEPQSSSTKNMIHFAQMIRDGTIRMYDYGDKNENKKHYGQPTPPSYNMTNIPKDVPLFVAYGGADALAVPVDVKLLLDNLHDHEEDKLVVHFQADYAHADYVFGVNAKQVVYDPLIAFFQLH